MRDGGQPLTAAATPETARDTLVERTLCFGHVLRRAGICVTPGRIIDVFHSLTGTELLDSDFFRLSLRVNLTSSRREERIFDRLFNAYWFDRNEVATQPEAPGPEPDAGGYGRELLEVEEELLGTPAQYSGDETLRDLNLAARWEEDPAVAELVRELVAKLSTRPSRRQRPVRRGRRLDLRRSLRTNARYGMDLIDLARADRRIRKTRIVLLCDVSGSMDAYNPFLLQMMFALQKQLKNSRTVVFSTRATEITNSLRRRSVGETLGEITRLAQHWSGGTNVGGALAVLNRQILCEGLASTTVAIIVSDGYDQGEPEEVEREMRALRRRVRSVVWINPLLGTQDYAPIARGMRAALPYVDRFLPAHDVPSLGALCKNLASV